MSIEAKTVITVEKLWTAASPGNGAARQGFGMEGALYYNKHAEGVFKVDSAGATPELILSKDVSGISNPAIAKDDVGNIVIFGGANFPTSATQANYFYILPKNASVGTQIAAPAMEGFSRADFIAANGNLCGAEGGHVYIALNNAVGCYDVTIQNGQASVVKFPASMTMGAAQTCIMLKEGSKLYYASALQGIYEYDGTTATLISGLTNLNNQCVGATKFTLAGKEIFVYHTGSIYTSQFSIFNRTDGTFVKDANENTSFFLNDVSVSSGGTLRGVWTNAEKIDDNNYMLYAWHSHDGGAVFKVSAVVSAEVTVTCDEALGSVRGGGDVAIGASTTVVATPKPGYEFVAWTIGGETVSTDASYNFVVNENTTLTAVFEAKPNVNITLAVNDASLGSINMLEGMTMGAYSVIYGTAVELTATPAAGATFVGWYKGEELYSKDVQITLNGKESISLVARFVSIPTINYQLNGGITNDYGWTCKGHLLLEIQNDYNAAYNQSINVVKYENGIYYFKIGSNWIPEADAQTQGLSVLVEGFFQNTTWTPDQKCAQFFLNTSKYQFLADIIDHFRETAMDNRTPGSLKDMTLSLAEAYYRADVSGFMLNSPANGAYPYTCDWSVCGQPEAFIPVWKHAFANPTQIVTEITLNAPYREGYIFEGWYATSDFSGEEITTINPESNIPGNTLYAKWIEDIPVGPTISQPEVGTLRVAIKIPEGSQCNGIALKGTMDGSIWSGENTYMGEDGAATSVTGNIYQFEQVKDSTDWFVVDVPASNTLQFKVCLIYADDGSWQGQARNVSYMPELSTLPYLNLSDEGQCWGFNANGGLLCLNIGGWMQSPCVVEPLVTRTITVTVPECGKEVPSLVGTFNDWDPTALPMTLVSGNTYTATVEAKASDQFKFAGSVSGWDNQIFVYVDIMENWFANPNLYFNEQTEFNIHFSDPTMYKWTYCQPEEPLGDLDASLTIDGDFSDWEALPAGSFVQSSVDENAVYKDLYNIKFVGDNQYVAFYMEYSGETDALQIFMNTDNNPSTGWNSYIWESAGADCEIEGWIGDGESFSDATLYPFEGEDQDGWNFSWDGMVEGIVYASDAVALPNGHYAIEGAIKRNLVPNNPQSLKVGVLASIEWLETGVLPEVAYADEGTYIYSPLLAVPMYANHFIVTQAMSGTCGEDLTWEVVNDTLLIHGTGAMTEFESASQRPWKAFESDIKTVIVDEGVTSIGDYAFIHFTNLRKLSLPTSLDSIGNFAFRYCYYIDTLALPEGLTKVGNGAFYGCYGTSSLNLPSTLTSVGSDAFAYMATVTSPLVIPAGLTDIGELAFRACSNVNGITVEAGNPVYDSRNYCDALIETATNRLLLGCASTIIPNDVVEIGDYAFGDNYTLSGITIPSSVNRIGNYAFMYNFALESITIPNSVTEMGVGVFVDCENLQTAVLPNGLTKLPESLFEYCIALQSVNIPAGVDTIGEFAFSECLQLTLPQLPTGLVYVGDYAFYGDSSLTWTELPASLQYIGGNAFRYCYNLELENLPAGLTYIGEAAFRDCRKLASVDIPSGITNIEYGTFYNCFNLASVTIPEGVLYIGGSAFAVYPAYLDSTCYSSLTSIVIPNSVEFIGDWAFANCANLTTVTLGSGLQTLGYDVFERCPNIQTITCYAVEPPAISNSDLTTFTKATILYVPAASVAAYEEHYEWGKLDVRPMGGTDIDLLEGADGATHCKTMINGQLYLIAPDGTRYDATGKRVE